MSPIEIIYHVSRILLGGLFFVFGLNAFFLWWGLPPMQKEMENFGIHLNELKIVMPIVKIFEVIFGAFLVGNFLPEIAWLALSPIVFFIVLAHLKFNRPNGYGMASFCAITFLGIGLQIVPRLAVIFLSNI